MRPNQPPSSIPRGSLDRDVKQLAADSQPSTLRCDHDVGPEGGVGHPRQGGSTDHGGVVLERPPGIDMSANVLDRRSESLKKGQ